MRAHDGHAPTRRELAALTGSMQQAAYARRLTYREGRADGLDAIEVKNGPLRFVAMASKALDVSEFEYAGTNLTFLSKPGLNGRNQFDTNGAEAQRSIMGGLFFTCGFENICAPVDVPGGAGYPMHGRVRTTPAEHVGIDARWEGDDYVIELGGEMREAELFGENLVLRRRIRTIYGTPSITVEDTVTNEAFRSEPVLWMYHCNFGWPLLDQGSRIIIPSLHASPRDATTAADPTPWDVAGAPSPNRPESVYVHDLAADGDGRTFAAIANPSLGLAVSLEFPADQATHFMEWKSMASGDYVVGLEPSNADVRGRAWTDQHAQTPMLEAGASLHRTLTFTVEQGADAIARLERRAADMVAARR